jgi:phage repressor protein C with HTH and peptisase S24 domain
MVAPWGERLSQRLEALGWSIPELAKRMGRGGDKSFEESLHKYVRGLVDQPRGNTMAEIAKAIGMTESELRNGSAPQGKDAPPGPSGVVIRELDYHGGMGGGGIASHEVVQHGDYVDPMKAESWVFPPSFVRNELHAAPSRIIIIEAQGDSMLPTIAPGERVVIDTSHVRPSPDGIYALRDQFGAIQIKRLHVLRRKKATIQIISDNSHHPTEEVRPDDITIVGRVICALRRF